MPCPHTPWPGRLLYSSTRTRSLSSTTRYERGSLAAASCADTSGVTPNAASRATACRRLSADGHSLFVSSMLRPLPIAASHLAEQVGVRLADRQSLGSMLQPQAQVAALV